VFLFAPLLNAATASDDRLVHFVPLLIFPLLIVIAFAMWVDAGRQLRASKPTAPEHDLDPRIDWGRLEARADSVIQWTIESLPERLRMQATEAGWTFRPWSREFSSRRIFGLAGGYKARQTPVAGGPIMLFLGDIILFVEHDGEHFDDEVRRAYLIAFGLKLGMSRDEIDALVGYGQ
jgi:hypothetical protein